ncbi:MAG TPA: hypothetical protein DCS93_40780 [Microscillaceae bacterium]|nr:hypothetical protein [Microscillaceae bacterium]
MRVLYQVLLGVMITCLSFTISAQPPNVDSLKQLLKTLPQDTNRAKVLGDLGWYYVFRDSQTSADYSKASLELAQKLNFQEQIAKANKSMGVLHDILGNHAKAVEYFFTALKIYESLGHKQGVATLNNNVGTAYTHLKDQETALKYYFKALKMNQQRKNTRRIGKNYNNIAVSYDKLEQFDKARLFYEKSLAIKRGFNDQKGMAITTMNIGGIYRKQGRLDSAEIRFLASYKTFKGQQDVRGQMLALGQVLSLKHQQKKWIEVLEVAQQIFPLIQKVRAYGQFARTYSMMSDAYYNTGQYKKAYEHFKQAATYRDSIDVEARVRKMEALKFGFELEKKEQQNKLLKKEKALKEAQLSTKEEHIARQRLWIVMVCLGLLLSTLLATVLYRQRQQKQKTNELLQQQKDEITTQAENLKQANFEISAINENLNASKQVIEQKNQDLTASINYAQRIQMALLPLTERIDQAIPENFILWKPRDIVSGDFYWFDEVDGKLVLAVVDCTGHGVPGAFMSMLGANLLTQIISQRKVTIPGEVLSQMNQHIYQNLKQGTTQNHDGMDMSLVCIDKAAQQIQFAGAFHSLLAFQNGEKQEIKGDRASVGGNQTHIPEAYSTYTLDVSQSTTFYLYSDGFPDQFGGPHNKKIGSGKFKSFLQEIVALPMSEQHQLLTKFLSEWISEAGQSQTDDVLVFGACIGEVLS